MNQTDENLICRLLDGDCSEVEIEGLCRRINEGKIDKKELMQQLKIHAALEHKLHEDPEGDLIFRAISRLDLSSTAKISGRVMKRLDAAHKKKKRFSKFIMVVAAIFLVAIGIKFSNYFDQLYSEHEASVRVTYLDKEVRRFNKEDGVLYQLNDSEFADYKSSKGDQIDLYPSSEFSVVGNQFYLNKGRLLADIAKRKNGEQLQFIAGTSKTIITGTNFKLNYIDRNGSKDYLLQLFEGSINFVEDNKQTSLKANQFLFFNDLDRNVVVGPLQDIKEKQLNLKEVFVSPKEYNWVPFFWRNWATDQLKISENKKNLILSGLPSETVVLTSEVVQTYLSGLHYDFSITPVLLQGEVEMGLRCFYSGVYSYEDSFTLERIGDQIKVGIVEVRRGKRSVVSTQMIHHSLLQNMKASGDISHRYQSDDKNSANKNGQEEEGFYIENVTFELFIRAKPGSVSKMVINSGKVLR